MSTPDRKKVPASKKLPTGIWALGFVSLFMDVSSEIVHSILPVFLVSQLGASVSAIGMLEGLAEALPLVVKIFSGPLSDWMGRRKPLALLGYAMGALSKPLFAISSSIGLVYFARLFDRTGKGLRGAPRDALVADLAPPELRGRAFGLRQSMDTCGAVLGPALAIGLLSYYQNDFRTVFWLATIPGFLSLSTLAWGVQEEGDQKTSAGKPRRLPRLQDAKLFPPAFWWVASAGAIFQLARFSEAFLVLRAQNLGLDLHWMPMVLVIMNVVYALSSYPIGALSDRMKRDTFLMLGLLTLILADLAMALATNLSTLALGVALWGLHLGLTQGTLTALVADTCPEERRGTAFGIFNLFCAVPMILGSALAGFFWDHWGPKWTFLSGAAFAAVSFLAFLSQGKPRGHRPVA